MKNEVLLSITWCIYIFYKVKEINIYIYIFGEKYSFKFQLLVPLGVQSIFVQIPFYSIGLVCHKKPGLVRSLKLPKFLLISVLFIFLYTMSKAVSVY